MIQYFKNINGQTVEIDKADIGVWVNLVPPFKEEEFIELAEDLDIPIEFLRDSLDIDERPRYEIEDNVIPSSNSVMANNLCKLSCYFENNFYENCAREMLELVIPSIDYPSAYSNWLSVALFFSENQKEVAICGKNSLEVVQQINQNYSPNVLIAGTNRESELPFLKNRFIKDETLFYVCQNKTCHAPIKNKEALYKDLNIRI